MIDAKRLEGMLVDILNRGNFDDVPVESLDFHRCFEAFLIYPNKDLSQGYKHSHPRCACG